MSVYHFYTRVVGTRRHTYVFGQWVRARGRNPCRRLARFSDRFLEVFLEVTDLCLDREIDHFVSHLNDETSEERLVNFFHDGDLLRAASRFFLHEDLDGLFDVLLLGAGERLRRRDGDGDIAKVCVQELLEGFEDLRRLAEAAIVGNKVCTRKGGTSAMGDSEMQQGRESTLGMMVSRCSYAG